MTEQKTTRGEQERLSERFVFSWREIISTDGPGGQAFKSKAEGKGHGVNPHPLFAFNLKRRLDESVSRLVAYRNITKSARLLQAASLVRATVHLPGSGLCLGSLLARSRERSSGHWVRCQLFPRGAHTVSRRLIGCASSFRHLRIAGFVLRQVVVGFADANLFCGLCGG